MRAVQHFLRIQGSAPRTARRRCAHVKQLGGSCLIDAPGCSATLRPEWLRVYSCPWPAPLSQCHLCPVTQSQCCLAALKAVCAQVSMANSSWTQAHIRQLWGSCPHLVYPPVDTASLQVQVLIHSLGL